MLHSSLRYITTELSRMYKGSSTVSPRSTIQVRRTKLARLRLVLVRLSTTPVLRRSTPERHRSILVHRPLAQEPLTARLKRTTQELSTLVPLRHITPVRLKLTTLGRPKLSMLQRPRGTHQQLPQQRQRPRQQLALKLTTHNRT